MRILILTTFFPPQNSIASHRPHSWARYWSEQGHEVVVATTPKEKCENSTESAKYKLIEVPPPRLIDRMKGKYQETQNSDPPWWKKALLAPYHYLRHERGILNAARMPDLTDLWIRPLVNRLSQEKGWDWIISTAGPYAVHIAAARLKKMGLTCYWGADFRDLWSDNHAYPGLFPFTCVENYLEKKLLQQADLITTVSTPWAERLGQKHGQDKVVVIENGFEPKDLLQLSEKSFFLADGKIKIVHTGMIYPQSQALHLLFEALKALPNPDKVECYFAGTHLAEIQKMRAKYQLNGVVKTLGNLSRQEALALQRDAHALLFFPWNDTKGSGAGLVSGKIYEYLYAQKPILAISEGKHPAQAAEQLIAESGAGVLLSTPRQIVDILDTLLNKENVLKPASPQFLDAYSREKLALKYLRELHRKTVQPLSKGN